MAPGLKGKVPDSDLDKHPLQRIESPSKTVSLCVHSVQSIGLASFYFAFRYLLENPNHINESFGWHLQYLTIIGLALATATFFFGLLADVEGSQTCFLLKNAFSVVSTPLEVLISMLYWGLRMIDPKLVIDPTLPDLPLLPDLRFHAFPPILLLIDQLFLSPPWTITTLPALGISAALAVSYWAWIELCHSKNGFYPYPLFTILSLPQRVLLFAFAAVVTVANTWVLKSLYSLINGVAVSDVGSGVVKKVRLAAKAHEDEAKGPGGDESVGLDAKSKRRSPGRRAKGRGGAAVSSD